MYTPCLSMWTLNKQWTRDDLPSTWPWGPWPCIAMQKAIQIHVGVINQVPTQLYLYRYTVSCINMYKPLVWSLFHFPFICAMVNLHGRNGAMSSHRKAACCESPSVGGWPWWTWGAPKSIGWSFRHPKCHCYIHKLDGQRHVKKQGHAACNGPAVFSPFHSQIFVSFATLTAFSWSAHLLSSSFWSAFYSVLCLWNRNSIAFNHEFEFLNAKKTGILFQQQHGEQTAQAVQVLCANFLKPLSWCFPSVLDRQTKLYPYSYSAICSFSVDIA